MAAKKDYVPDSALNLRDWAKMNVENAPTKLTGLEGWDAARIAALVARFQSVLTAAQAVLDAQAALDTKTGALESALDDELPEIRQDVANLKRSRGWTDGIGDALELNTPSASTDTKTLKPRLSADSQRGQVVLMARKLGADSVNLYSRRRGETGWRLLASKRVRFPFADQAPPATAGQPEEREYYAQAVLGDDEVGLPSDIVTGVFRG